ncbi:MAG: hypothetical protein JRC93_04100 [Deltaproteobacteria bacterium]|nr:hypothetical protein [Deltaproteobacteria bacterium]
MEVTLADMTLGTFTSSGFKELDSTNTPGHYTFCPPNAAIASAATYVDFVFKGAADLVQETLRIHLAPQVDVQQIGGDTQSATDFKDLADTGYDPTEHKIQGVLLTDTATDVTNDVGITQAGADKVWGTTVRSLSTFGTLIADIWANASRTLTDKAGFSLSTAGILAIWHQLVAAVVTESSMGKLIKDYLDATVSSRSDGTGVTLAADQEVNMTKIAGDATAPGNIANTYNTTGYTDDAAPATQEQVGRLAVGSAAISTTAENSPGGFVITTGLSEANTEDVTHALDGVTHDLEDDNGTTDAYYIFDVGGNGVPVSVQWDGYVNAQGDSYGVYAWNWTGTPAWEQIGSIAGLSGSTVITEVFDLTNAHVGTGANRGLVHFRFHSTDGTKFATDRILCQYAVVTKSVGYALGAIWINTNISNTNTEPYVDGTADNPVSTLAAAKILSSLLPGIDTFYMGNGSTIILDTTCSNHSFIGKSYALALGGQQLDHVHIEGATVTGEATSNGVETEFFDCHFGNATPGWSHLTRCALSGTFTVSEAQPHVLNTCIADDIDNPPIIDFADIAADIGLRCWSGGLKVTNMAVGSVLTMHGMGYLIIDSTCNAGGLIRVSGNIDIIDNVDGGFAGTLDDDARFAEDQKLALVDVVTTNTDMRGTDNASTHDDPDPSGYLDVAVSSRSSHGDPDPSGYIDTAISGRSSHSAADAGSAAATAVLVTPAQKLKTDASGEVTAENMRGTDGVDTAAMRGTDGVDTAAMRGTDGANTITPPTTDEINTALGVTHGTGNWEGGGTAPTVEEIDTELSTSHGEGTWTTGGSPIITDGVTITPASIGTDDEALGQVMPYGVISVYLGDATDPQYQHTADADGDYSFELPEGSVWTLIARVSGYEDTTAEVSTVEE